MSNLTNATLLTREALCSSDEIDSRDTGCPFPYVNAGWDDPEKYVEGDCSLTYADVHGSIYGTKCLVYTVLSVVPCLLCILNLKKAADAKKAAKKKAKGLNIMEKAFICIGLMSFGKCLYIHTYIHNYKF